MRKWEHMYKKLLWTEHSKLKMRQYGLSKLKIISIIARPERKEQGIAEHTTAVMRTNKVFGRSGPASAKASAWQGKRAPGETWIMYQDKKGFRNVISAWRYPGATKPGESVPVPEDIKRELQL